MKVLIPDKVDGKRVALGDHGENEQSLFPLNELCYLLNYCLAAEVLGVRGSHVLKSYEERLESTSRAGQAGKAGLHNLTAIACSSSTFSPRLPYLAACPAMRRSVSLLLVLSWLAAAQAWHTNALVVLTACAAAHPTPHGRELIFFTILHTFVVK